MATLHIKRTAQEITSDLLEVADLLASNTDGTEYDALIDLRNELNTELCMISSEAA